MATTSRGWLPVATGLATAGLAIWLVAVVVAPEPEAEPVAATTAVLPTTDAPPTSAAEPVAESPVVITTPPPQIAGLTESIARVLATRGFASSLTADDIASQLPPSVYRALVDNGVVLSIATEGSGQ